MYPSLLTFGVNKWYIIYMDRSALNNSIGLPEMDAQHYWLYSLFDRIEPAGKSGNAGTMKALLNEEAWFSAVDSANKNKYIK